MVDRRRWAQGVHVQCKVAKFMDYEYLTGWLAEHEILETLVGAGKHPELLKRSIDIVRFLTKGGTCVCVCVWSEIGSW